MKRVKIKSIEITVSDMEQLSVDYYLNTDMVLNELGEEIVENYGVTARNPDSGEETEIKNVTINSENIYKLIDILAANTVTPMCLRDVIEDWI